MFQFTISRLPGAWRPLIWLCVFLLSLPLQATLKISEFLAENDGGLRDVDGESPDWIEIQNDSAAPVNLNGWHLTDSELDLTRWTFPNMTLPAGAFLVVFASGKDRAVGGAELHTSFQLDRNGGFVGLVHPDGVTVVSAFTNYPALRRNVSFGPGNANAMTSTLLPAGAPALWLVPVDNSLGLSWATPGFNPAGWTSAGAPLTYKVLQGGIPGDPVLSVDFNDRDDNNAANTQPGFQSFVIGNSGGNGAIQTGSLTRNYGAFSVTLSDNAGAGYDDRFRSTPANDGAFTLEDIFRDFVFSRDYTGTSGLDLFINGLVPGQLYETKVWSFDTGSVNNRVSDWYANRTLLLDNYTFNGAASPNTDDLYSFSLLATADETGGVLISGRRDDSGLANSPGVFINAFEVAPVSAMNATNGNLTALAGRNSSVYVRQLFSVTDPTAFNQLTLRIRYDDGFVAYLNGVEVVRRNAPTNPAWNSAATGANDAGDLQEIPLASAAELLVPGENVLAVHGLNVAAGDDDFFLAPELVASFNTLVSSRFFTPPTPGAVNDAGFEGLVADTKFSVNRGFFEAPFTVAITTATANAQIRWTTNGSLPTLTGGTPYTGPITIPTTTYLRAAAYRTGFIPTDVDTQTYLFLAQVIRQPAVVPGYPTIWPDDNYPADYQMDPNVVNDPDYSATLLDDMRTIPTLSIVTDHNSLWNNSTGIYLRATSGGQAWERAASAELINPDGSTAFAVNCGLRMQGAASRDNIRTAKHSFRLLFKSIYGPAKLTYDWFSGSVDRFDTIVLRACFTDGWTTRYSPGDGGARYRPQDSLYLRDVWTKDSLGDMGHHTSRGDFVHLYVNGLYWGLYNPCERQDASFFSQHLGGREEDWDVIRDFSEVFEGSKNNWNQMMALANAGVATDSQYRAMEELVDIDSLIDYMLLHVFAEAEDWPSHNWYAARRRASPELPATKWIFLVWDQEIVLDRQVRRNRINVNNNDTPARIYSQLRSNPEFRLRFADRVQKHLFNNGALTPSNNIARLQKRVAQIDRAIVGESARWGDAREFATPGNPATGQTLTRNGHFIPEVQGLYAEFFPTLNDINVGRFRAGDLYPDLDAPFFNQFGGAISNGFGLVITHANSTGLIYFTLDGSDPRTYGTGNINPLAQAYSQPIEFNAPTLVRARVFSGGQWSALVEASFFPPQDLSSLVLTEIMYNPPALSGVDGDEFEFLELKNVGTRTLDLGGLHFTGGLSYTFPVEATLAPGTFWVLPRNSIQFANKYPGVTVDGIYSGRLANGGEVITLSLPGAGRLFSVDFRDTPPWPTTADGHGFSLAPRDTNPVSNSDNGQDWRGSSFPGGSPGADDPAPVVPVVLINELLANPLAPVLDQVELYNPGPGVVNLGGWFLTDDPAAPNKYRIPDGTLIAAGGYLAFSETQFNPTPGSGGSFAFGSRGDDVFLFSANGTGQLTGYSHGFAFGASPTGVSFGRHVNSVGEEDFVAELAATLGSANAGPMIGPIVISEIHYHPAAGGDEFVELANLTGEAVPLFDPAATTNTWVLSGLSYSFPTGITLTANGQLLLVATNPSAFRFKYSIPAQIPILGPYQGVLQDSGERLELRRPGVPDTNGVPYYAVDMVRYNDRSPWNPAADGAGPSLQRTPVSAYGNDPAHWMAAAPTPGQLPSTGDTDGDGLPDDWEVANGTQVFVPDADEDPDGDGVSNYDEWIAGTDPQSAESYLKVSEVVMGGGGVILRFLAASDHTYNVLCRSTIDSGLWQNVAFISAAPADRTVSVTNSLSGASQFYRVVTPGTE